MYFVAEDFPPSFSPGISRFHATSVYAIACWRACRLARRTVRAWCGSGI